MNKDHVSIEELEYYRDYFNKQEGRKYPCSNQTVRCIVITDDKDKAVNFMRCKPVAEKREYDHGNIIEWFLKNGDKWLWRVWNGSCRSYRFYKIAIDKNVDKELFEYLVLPYCNIYCCSFEIF